MNPLRRLKEIRSKQSDPMTSDSEIEKLDAEKREIVKKLKIRAEKEKSQPITKKDEEV